eukprot:COSAG05_NODE_949_length_6474_cov_7.735216_7_plen_45_part_00
MMVAGDGRVDRLLLDTNRDGKVDTIGYDTTGDGRIDSYRLRSFI